MQNGNESNNLHMRTVFGQCKSPDAFLCFLPVTCGSGTCTGLSLTCGSSIGVLKKEFCLKKNISGKLSFKKKNYLKTKSVWCQK